MSDNLKIVTGEDLEARANKEIADWGTKHSSVTCDDNEETSRTCYRRQRDRILYTGGFRRLQDKTQVIAASKNGDHRTRLTHSLEVEQIAMSMADAMSLNKDLVSAIALGHDIGHTPFGHAVERLLNKKLKAEGGFSHAVQSVRYLENNDVRLSNEVLQGILKHDTDVYACGYDKKQHDCSKLLPHRPGNLEAQVVYWADKIAYVTHDLEDFYNTGIYTNAKGHNNKLEKQLREVLAELVEDKDKSGEIRNDISKFETRDLVRNLLKNLIANSMENIQELAKDKVLSPDVIIDVTSKRIDEYRDKNFKVKEAYQRGLIINFSKMYYETYLELREILNNYYIFSPEVQRFDAKAVRIIDFLFEEFVENPEILPLNIKEKIKDKKDKSDIKRVVADYIASMTDRYAEGIYSDFNLMDCDYKY